MIGAVQTVLVGPLLFVPGAGCLAAGTASAESIAIPASRDTTLIEDAEGARSNGAGPCFAGRVSAPDDPRRRASRHALRLILSGVFDDYPRLKIVLGHMGESLPVAGAWIAAFAWLPTLPVAAALAGWIAYITPKVRWVSQEFQDVNVSSP